METRILQFISALRAAGVRISLAESTEAFQAVDHMGIQNRETFRLSLRATLIKDARHLPIFERLFPLFFGSATQPALNNVLDDLTPDEAHMLAEALRQLAEHLRRQVQRLLEGRPLSPEELNALARLVGLDHIQDWRYQAWLVQRMERALAFPEVRQALRELWQALSELGMNRQRIEQIRRQVEHNLQGLSQQLSRFVGQRIAENLSQTRRPLEGLDGLMNRPFQALSEAEKNILQREVRRLAAALRTRIALRQKRAKTGFLDPKATLRANLKHQSVPILIRHRDRSRKPKIVALCDISTSMRFCSELMLSFLFALQGQVRKTHAFAFIDHLEYISNDFRGSDGNAAVAHVLQRMPAGHYNTDLGYALQNFVDDYLDTLNGQTTLIVVGDGRNNYNDPRLDLFSLLTRRAARTLWLNPEPPVLWGTGDSDMHRYAPYCDQVLKVATLAELIAAIDTILEG